ncbi:ZIP family metal transporter [Candidatus Kuenenia sp.]|uniref:ZIP family metal transporter n=1 Tax=Candidatus Kuenenia sp. TaxID=2499824 RepID=UPI0032204DC2
MINVWFYTLASVFAISICSLIGVVTLSFRETNLKQVLIYFVSFSAGSLLGNAFLHLLPEAVEKAGSTFRLSTSLFVLCGVVVYFSVEKFIRWRHCHIPATEEHPHPFSLMVLFGDAVHNFIDGLIIGASYMVSIPIGFATTMAVVFHEIPQEVGDFGSLLHGGFSKIKALFFNFLSALAAILGAVIVLVLGSYVEGLTTFLVPFAAGGFIYVASCDLIPELHREVKVTKSILQLAFFILGVLVMLALSFVGE